MEKARDTARDAVALMAGGTDAVANFREFAFYKFWTGLAGARLAIEETDRPGLIEFFRHSFRVAIRVAAPKMSTTQISRGERDFLADIEAQAAGARRTIN